MLGEGLQLCLLSSDLCVYVRIHAPLSFLTSPKTLRSHLGKCPITHSYMVYTVREFMLCIQSGETQPKVLVSLYGLDIGEGSEDEGDAQDLPWTPFR